MELRTWNTTGAPPAGRFGIWGEALASTHLDWELVGSERDFSAEVVARNVGDLRLVGCRCDPCEGFRTSRHVNRDGGHIGILFEMSGTEVVRQGGREATLNPGDFVIWDSDRAMEFRVLERLHKFTILTPKASLRRFLPDIEQFAGMRVDGTDRLGPLVGAHLRQLSAGLDRLDDRCLRLVADTTLELVAAGLSAKQPDARGADAYHRVRDYITDRLADPTLSPATIAASNGISLRYLHKLFAMRGRSVSRWILCERLARCRKAIEGERRDRSVTEIALSWGFNDGSHFSRSFCNEFGVSARELRRSLR